MKKFMALLLCLALVAPVMACGGETDSCNHSWEEATCEKPKTCNLCMEVQGYALGHNWKEATCTTPKSCTLCYTVVPDSVKAHDYGVEGDQSRCINCGEKSPDYFDANSYGFINNYGMYTWMEITSYYERKIFDEVIFREEGREHSIYSFKDGVCYNYSRHETPATNSLYIYDNKNPTEKLFDTKEYTIINNDSVSRRGTTITIFERIYDQKGRLIFKVMFGSMEKWFVLVDQIDWEKSPTSIDTENGWKDYTYYFKNN